MDEILDAIVFARSYVNEIASRVQYEAFARYLERKNIDGVSAYRFTEGGTYVIGVVDLTENQEAREFKRAGDPYELSEATALALFGRIGEMGAGEPLRLPIGRAA